MSLQEQYEFLVILLMAIIVLEFIARRLLLPPAAALIAGGAALAFVPGIPSISLDPELVLVLFLPPLLLSSAYSTAWRDFKRHSTAIISLAVGAVFFTTAAVAISFHLMFPEFPWAVGFALGACVSPPDAVAVKVVLEKLRLPSHVKTVLGGESLVNDASGLVLFHFAVAWAAAGSFSAGEALLTFSMVSVGGVVIGLCVGQVGIRILERLGSSELVIAGTLLLAASSYIIADQCGASGVLSTVATGLLLGWRQHEIFSAATRIAATGFWKVLVFIMQSMLFILVGLSLRGTLDRIEANQHPLGHYIVPVLMTVAVVLLSRFLWLMGSHMLRIAVSRFGLVPTGQPTFSVTMILSWAGIRGPVTLAAALALPDDFPGRDVILLSAFGVIFVTVIIQGPTLPLLVKMLPATGSQSSKTLADDEARARKRMSEVQYAALADAVSGDTADRVACVLDFYRERAEDAARNGPEMTAMSPALNARSDFTLRAVKAGRAELLRMYRAGEVSDHVLRKLELDLDVQEYGAEGR